MNNYKNVIFIPYETNSNMLVKKSSVVFNLTGTLGYQAIFNNTQSIVVENYYSDKKSFFQFNSVTSLVDEINSFLSGSKKNITEEDKKILVKRIMSSSFDGNPWSFLFNGRDGLKSENAYIFFKGLNSAINVFFKN